MRTTPLLCIGTVLSLAAWLPPSEAHAESPALTGDVLVRLDVNDSALLDRLVARDDVLAAEHREGSWPLYTLRLGPDAKPETLVAILEQLPGVRWAWADRYVPTELHALPLNDTYADQLWHLENTVQTTGGLSGADINVLPAWEITDGTGQLIGVIDGGVELTHPDLRLQSAGWDAIDQDLDATPGPDQGNPGHGTLVAGLAAAVGNNNEGVAGVAYGAAVFPVRAIGGSISQGAMYDSFIRAVDAGCTVINNSWGYIPEEPCGQISELPAMNEAMSYAREEGRGGLGTVIVFSAGNQGCEQNNYPMLNDNPGIVAVGSITDQSRKWGYSVWGAHLDIGAPSGGVGGGSRPSLWSTDMWGDAGFNGQGDNNEYSDRMGGTSGAAPIVAGTVALMLAANPRIREDDVRRVLCVTADKIDPEGATYNADGWSSFYGCGRVDAGAAVAAVANGAPPAPELVMPLEGGEIEIGAAPISWTTVIDPDGDALTYEVEIRQIAGDDDSAEDDPELAVRSGIVEPEYALRGLDWETGEHEVRVAARDLWGLGEWSEWVSFGIARPIPPPPAETPDDDDGCAGCDGGGSLALLLLLMPLGLRRRP